MKGIFKQPASRKVFLFKVIGILLPFLFLVLLEGVLRAFHYGNDLRLFIEYAGSNDFLVLNPDASKRYFTNQSIATTGNHEIFKKKKDENTTRIFVLGESTTLGYPYFHNGSFHRWLQYRLMRSVPGRNFEIINLSLTAVNSYTTLGFAHDLADYDPDAVLIYTGHNEYYGAPGVASTERVGDNLFLVHLTLRLREFRLFQLLTNFYEKVTPGDAVSGGTRMQRMVAEEHIPYGSALYLRGIGQFKSNMEEAVKLLHDQHVPVFISNLVSNEKDLKPFVSDAVDSMSFPGFTKNYELGLNAAGRDDLPLAHTFLIEAQRIYPVHARCNYELGKIAWRQGEYDTAKAYFVKAKDLDGLRFRAPEKINEFISELCKRYSRVHLVDTKAAFEGQSPHRCIGGELILEHVHPNLKGYAIMSDVFYEAMKREKLIEVPIEDEMTFAQLVQSMPVNAVDSIAGVLKIARLRSSWPFTEALGEDSVRIGTEEGKLALKLVNKQIGWDQAMDLLYAKYIRNHQLASAREVMETLVLEYPEDASVYEKAAMLSGELKDDDEALFYFSKAFRLNPTFDRAKYLFVLYLHQDKPADAMEYIDYAIANAPGQLNLAPVKTYTSEVIRLQKALASHPADLSILFMIAQAYYRMDNREGASIYLGKVLELDPGNEEALVLLEKLKG